LKRRKYKALPFNWKNRAIFKEEPSIFQEELYFMSRNIFKRCEAHFEAGCWHFETLTSNMVKKKCRGK
jgi:hypothetical protein